MAVTSTIKMSAHRNDWWAMVALCAPPRHVGHREYLLISVLSDQCFLSASLFITAHLCIYPVDSSSPGIPSIIPRNPQISLCVCTALGWQCLKTLSLNFLSDVIIWWWFHYFGACWSLFLVSLNTPNKQRAPSAFYLSPFPPVIIHTDRWFEFESCQLRVNIRNALKLSHILIDNRADGHFAAIPLTLCLLQYLFEWI